MARRARSPPNECLRVTAEPADPPAAPILAGDQRQRPGVVSRAVRPTGTRDWLLVATLAGAGFVRAGGVRHTLEPGDLLLFRPGSPQDYGHRDDSGTWRNVWVHFQPREDWLRWLAWPALAPGIMRLRRPDLLARLRPQLSGLARALDGTALGRLDAMNRLERVLIDAADRTAEATVDPRLRRVIDHVQASPAARLDGPALAALAGLSRSRLSAMFQAQLGTTPQAFVERARLMHAAGLLQSTRAPLAVVAARSGFASSFYFSTRFRRAFGTSPRQYRHAAHRLDPAEPPGRT
ncbi:helix-turn-helix domain-containing protein [Sphingomonas sp. SFZ2018-12]|nr:helix-turn-helix domain-containing protein [Sphingomonas sp. SFZ2018-12]MCH4893261.1 helix-turn-helix domain-containing protein [Sphingomonas sp. SFZ2018-12]